MDNKTQEQKDLEEFMALVNSSPDSVSVNEKEIRDIMRYGFTREQAIEHINYQPKNQIDDEDVRYFSDKTVSKVARKQAELLEDSLIIYRLNRTR